MYCLRGSRKVDEKKTEVSITILLRLSPATHSRVRLVIRSTEHHNLVEMMFWFHLMTLWHIIKWKLGTKSITKCGNENFVWFTLSLSLSLLLPTPIIWFLLDWKRQRRKKKHSKFSSDFFTSLHHISPFTTLTLSIMRPRKRWPHSVQNSTVKATKALVKTFW